MKRIIGFLVLTIALFTVRHAGAAEICTPDNFRVASDQTEQTNKHGAMCIQTARVLAQLVRDSGLPCNAVVGSILYPERRAYFVTCLVVDVSYGTPPDRVQRHINYVSRNDSIFQPLEQ